MSPKYEILNVWHVGAWNRNVGDWAMAFHMHRMLDRQARERGAALKFYMVDSQRTLFHPALIDQMNEEADLVLIGGGGLIFLRPEDESKSGWSFNTTTAEVDRIKKPIVVYGVGYNRFPYDPNSFPEITGRHLQHLQKRSEIFSARDVGTKDALVGVFGCQAKGVDVVPDAGLALHDRAIDIPALRAGRKGLIGLNFAGDRPHYRFPREKDWPIFQKTVKKAMLEYARDGWQIMFLPHLIGIDSDMYESFAEGFPKGSIFSTHKELSYLYPPAGEMLYSHIPFFTNLFRKPDLTLGMRGHTCIISFGAGTPFMPLGAHRKLGDFSADLDVPLDYSLGLPESAETMSKTMRRCLADAKYKKAIRDSVPRQVKKIEVFNERVLDVFVPKPKKKLAKIKEKP